MLSQPTYTSQEFLYAFKKGEEKAFDQLFREYFAPLSLFAYQLLHNEEEAEDIVQNCFEKLWKRRKSLPHIESIKSYLYTSIRYSCINSLKNKKNEVIQQSLLPEIKDFTSDVESLIVMTETIRELYAVVELLPERMREVFKLYYLEGKSYKEISEILHTEPETIRNQRFKAIQFIRKNYHSHLKSFLIALLLSL